MMGPAISETSSTNEVKKADTSVQVERLAASRKIGALPGPHRHKICPVRSLCCDCEISDEFSLQRIWQDLGSVSVQVLHYAVADCPCESSREPFCQGSMSGIASSQSFAMKAAGARFFARQEYRSHLNGLCAESQGGDYTSCISYSSRGNHRHIDDVDD